MARNTIEQIDERSVRVRKILDSMITDAGDAAGKYSNQSEWRAVAEILRRAHRDWVERINPAITRAEANSYTIHGRDRR